MIDANLIQDSDKSETAWIDLEEQPPEDGQKCDVLFNDKTASTGIYWADFDLFALDATTPYPPPDKVTHWKPRGEERWT